MPRRCRRRIVEQMKITERSEMIEEKESLSRLNEHFSSYLQTIRYLQLENDLLNTQIELINTSFDQ